MYLGDRLSNPYTVRRAPAQESSGEKLLLYSSAIIGETMRRSMEGSLEIC